MPGSVPSDDASPSADLEEDIQDHVKAELAGHEYPCEAEFAAALPKTVTGRIHRTELRDATGGEADDA